MVKVQKVQKVTEVLTLFLMFERFMLFGGFLNVQGLEGGKYLSLTKHMEGCAKNL